MIFLFLQRRECPRFPVATSFLCHLVDSRVPRFEVFPGWIHSWNPPMVDSDPLLDPPKRDLSLKETSKCDVSSPKKLRLPTLYITLRSPSGCSHADGHNRDLNERLVQLRACCPPSQENFPSRAPILSFCLFEIPPFQHTSPLILYRLCFLPIISHPSHSLYNGCHTHVRP